MICCLFFQLEGELLEGCLTIMSLRYIEDTYSNDTVCLKVLDVMF